MSDDVEKYCPNCGAKVPLEAVVCPYCGHRGLVTYIVLEEIVTLREQIQGKAKTPGMKRPKFEFKVGDDQYRKTGEWNYVERTIDREHDQYREIIRDSNGNIIRYVDEPLSQHRGHGSAKYSKKRAKKKRQ